MKMIDHMEYMKGMERLESDIMTRVIDQMEAYDYDSFTCHLWTFRPSCHQQPKTFWKR